VGLDNLLGWKANVDSLPRNGKAGNFNAIWPREDIKLTINPDGDSYLRMIVATLEQRLAGSKNSSSSNTASPACTEPRREEM
jgi:hypothetical protein